MPDIDVDFCQDRRGEVITYVSEKYGKDHVAQIITFGTMAAKAAIRDVGRAMDMAYAEVDKIAKLVPNTLKITIESAMKQEPQLKELYDTNDEVRGCWISR
jgi:DNA polymerase-3 subunit alpha